MPGRKRKATATVPSEKPKKKRVYKRYDCECEAICEGVTQSLSKTAYYRHRIVAAMGSVVSALTGKNKKKKKRVNVPELEDDRRRLEDDRHSEDGADPPDSSLPPKRYRVTVEDAPDEDDERGSSMPPGGSQRGNSPLFPDFDNPFADPADFSGYSGRSRGRTPGSSGSGSRAASPRSRSGQESPGPRGLPDDAASDRSSMAPPDDPALPEDDEQQVEVTMKDIKTALDFINLLKGADLRSRHSGLTKGEVNRLRHPPREILQINDPVELLSIKIYLGLGNSAQTAYNNTRTSLAGHTPPINLLSLSQVKRKIRILSGVVPIVNDMCVGSCLAFTGPYADDERCAKCQQPRYRDQLGPKGERIPRQKFYTMPLGPQLQALVRTPEGAESMDYLAETVDEVLAELEESGKLSSFDDVSHGSHLWGSYAAGHISPDDIVVTLSIDGAQLYRNKKSDCWIYIWVVLNLGPDKRYRKRYVLPGAVIPGPDHPKDMDSFLFPGLYHASCLMQEGLNVWNAARNERLVVALFLLYVLADGPAMALLAGTVGHTGARGCRLWCPLKGRRKDRRGTYYPALLKPAHGYKVKGSSHDDVHPSTFDVPPDELSKEYEKMLERLLAAKNDGDYEKIRKDTGLTKPCIFSGLSRALRLPGPFPLDYMHLSALNLTILFFALWCATIKGGKKDPDSFPWAVLADKDEFAEFGKEVARASPFLPGCFDRPPRNIAEKINSGYKAKEWTTAFYGYGPAMLRRRLPPSYWSNYCMLVRAACILGCCSITEEELAEATELADKFGIDFELLYYNRDPDLLHHVRPCVHWFMHAPREVIKTGPLVGITQAPMERTIGNLEEEIHQPSDSFANLSERACLRCQHNTITAAHPELSQVYDKDSAAPRGAVADANGYVFLCARERTAHHMSAAEAEALEVYLADSGLSLPGDMPASSLKVQRWARLKLPNGQIIRSLFAGTERKPLAKVRIARMAKLVINGRVEIGEVHCYCRIRVDGTPRPRPVAVVSLFGQRDEALYATSHKTVWLAPYKGAEDVRVVDVSCLRTVVGMVPDSDVVVNLDDANEPHFKLNAKYFLVEKMGHELASRTGDADADEDEDEDEHA